MCKKYPLYLLGVLYAFLFLQFLYTFSCLTNSPYHPCRLHLSLEKKKVQNSVKCTTRCNIYRDCCQFILSVLHFFPRVYKSKKMKH